MKEEIKKDVLAIESMSDEEVATMIKAIKEMKLETKDDLLDLFFDLDMNIACSLYCAEDDKLEKIICDSVTNENVRKALRLLYEQVASISNEMLELTIEFFDEVEEDMHVLYNMQQLRKRRNKCFDIIEILNQSEERA